MDMATEMTESTLLRVQSESLWDFFNTAAIQFRNGEDATGIESLLTAMAELKKLVEIDQSSQHSQIDMNQLLPAVRKLYFYIQNQDITGIADLLEDTFYPLIKEWLKGCGNT